MRRSTTEPQSSALSRSSEEAAARSGMYALLARLWLREVDRDLLRLLNAPPLRESFVVAGGVLPANDSDQTIEQLAIDYCQIFIGPANPLPPYQSVWQSGQFQGATIQSMQRFIDVTGYDAAALPSGIMLDHLGVQLDVMGYIVRQLSTSPADSDDSTIAADVARTFFSTHLTWPGPLFQAAERQATTDFYRATILMARDFLESEANEFT